jgi:DUF1009 family protein
MKNPVVFANQKIAMAISNLKSEKIALIAGDGNLPKLIIDELNKQKIDFIILIPGNNLYEKTLANTKCFPIKPGKVKQILNILNHEKVTSIIFAGHIKRPGLLSLNFDSVGLSLLAKITACKIQGDNSVLSVISKFLEEQGFKVIAPNIILPSLLAPTGILGKIQPDEDDLKDIKLGQKVLSTLSDMDIGQAVIVENNYVLGIEAAEGTDNLIIRCKELKRENMRKGVLIKMKKTNQDARLDLPTIGPITIENVFKSNLKGIAITAQKSIIINLAEVVRLADKYGIFIIGI